MGNTKRHKSQHKSKKTREKAEFNHSPSKEGEVAPIYDVFNYTDFMQENKNVGPIMAQNLSHQQARVMQLTHMKFNQPSNGKSKDKIMRVRNCSKDLNSGRKTVTFQNSNTIDRIRTQQRQSISQLHRQLSLTNANNKITLENPLFNLTYFKDKQAQDRRLNKETKKKKLSFIYRKLAEPVSH